MHCAHSACASARGTAVLGARSSRSKDDETHRARGDARTVSRVRRMLIRFRFIDDRHILVRKPRTKIRFERQGGVYDVEMDFWRVSLEDLKEGITERSCVVG
jgi:hypothetical protein